MNQQEWSSEGPALQEVDGWERDDVEPGDPRKPLSAREHGGFPQRMGKRTRNSFLSFAAWMGGAEMTLMLCVVYLSLGNSFPSFSESVVIFYWAAVVGAVLGFIPAVLAAVFVFMAKKRPPLWVTGLISMPITLGTVFLALWLILRSMGGMP